MVTSRSRPLDRSDTELLDLPVDRLGLEILSRLAGDAGFFSWHNWNNAWREHGISETSPVMRAFGEAWGWLQTNNLVAQYGLNDSHFVTRLGHDVIDNGPGFLGAVQRASHDVHARIETAVRQQFMLGEYELAAFAALREVEIAVREATNIEGSVIGKDLMRKAFAVDDGPLTDRASDRGERQGLGDLFAGAIATFKNPTSHRQVPFDEPTEAAEVISLASLLLRILDRATQQSNPPATTPDS